MISEPTRTSRLKLSTRPATTAIGRARALHQPTSASGSVVTPGGQDHRQHRDDARRDAGHDPGDEPDADELGHPAVPSVVGADPAGCGTVSLVAGA